MSRSTIFGTVLVALACASPGAPDLQSDSVRLVVVSTAGIQDRIAGAEVFLLRTDNGPILLGRTNGRGELDAPRERITQANVFGLLACPSEPVFDCVAIRRAEFSGKIEIIVLVAPPEAAA
jgi:hypothetical protein